MKHILHIFAKDMRHLWIEILLSLTITGALVLVFPQRWTSWTVSGPDVSFSPRGGSMVLWGFILTGLVPISWWILMSSSIHEERLVGDRQYWLTRPYEWPLLLGAKALFVTAFIYVPLLIAQLIILLLAGFPPLSYIPGVLYNVLILSAGVILPLFALATITNNFVRMTLATLAAILGLVGIANLSSQFVASRIATPFGDKLSLFLFAAGCVAVAVLQYATRKTAAGWLLFAITLVMITTVACIPPDQALVNHKFPVSSENVVQLVYRAEAGDGPSAYVTKWNDQIGISIPVDVSGVPTGSLLIPEDVKVRVDAPGGYQWTSVWQPIYMNKFLPGERVARANFNMPRSIYDRLKSTAIHVRITFALSRAVQGATTSIAMPSNEFKVPGFATCSPLGGVADKPDEIGSIVCRSAIREPPLTLVQVEWSYDACHDGTSEKRRDIQGAAWVGSLERTFAEFVVWSQPILFTNRQPDYQAKEPQHICPGSPATFTTYAVAGHTQVSLDVDHFLLPELSRGQLTVMDKP